MPNSRSTPMMAADKDRLRDCSLREDNGVRPKRGAPSYFPRLSCGLLGFGDSATYCIWKKPIFAQARMKLIKDRCLELRGF
jgi:hypothetical protein